MYKSCPYCGRIHAQGYECPKKPKRKYCDDREERRLRSTSAWTRKSIEVREKAKGLCEVCRDKGTITYKNISVHHIEKVRDNKDKLLDNYNLIALCARHHEQAEKGELSKEYLRRLAREREKI